MGPIEEYVDYEGEELAAEDIWAETGGEGMQAWESVLPSLETGQLLELGSSFEPVFRSVNEEDEGLLILSEVQDICTETALEEAGQEFSPGNFLIRDSSAEEGRGNDPIS